MAMPSSSIRPGLLSVSGSGAAGSAHVARLSWVSNSATFSRRPRRTAVPALSLASVENAQPGWQRNELAGDTGASYRLQSMQAAETGVRVRRYGVRRAGLNFSFPVSRLTVTRASEHLDVCTPWPTVTRVVFYLSLEV
jgi:hypothetical protein